MAAAGSDPRRRAPRPSTGIAWFDHQWGDFISVGGGWDWFAINLDDGTDLTLSVVRDAAGEPVARLRHARRRRTGPSRHLAARRVRRSRRLDTLDQPARPGATYPIGWRIEIPDGRSRSSSSRRSRTRSWTPGATTGVVYWEGSQHVVRDAGRPTAIGGEAYVELTRYSD